jgi:hypothetical protein
MKKTVVTAESIKGKVLENYFGYLKLFAPAQSEFLSDLYKRYKCLNSATIVLHFAKKTHQSILRKKEYDLNHDLSFEKFWDNHNEIVIESSTILNVAKSTSLPKETARRKLSELIKKKVLFKTKKNIIWKPTDEYKISYNQIVEKEIRYLAKLTRYVLNTIGLDISTDEIAQEYKKKFSFYWFHFLDLQLKWMKLWKTQMHDLEISMMYMHIASYLTSRVEESVSHDEVFSKPDIINRPIKKNLNVSLSATALSDLTGIPRATCIRKLNLMASRKIVSQDENSKRYFIHPESLSKQVISKELVEKMQGLFSEFYLIVIRSLNSKNSN